MTDELTRERIEKVKKNVCISLDSLADENGEVAKSHKDDLSTMLALANAELERQSVTEEDVAEAIERVNEQINTLADIIDELVEEQGEEAMVEDVKEALRVEITCLAALQTYRPKREPCEYCRPRKAWEVPNDGIYAYQEVNTLGEIQGWSLSVYGGMICFGNAQGRPTYIANCPMCGRRLED